jgi:hypothetical protein
MLRAGAPYGESIGVRVRVVPKVTQTAARLDCPTGDSLAVVVCSASGCILAELCSILRDSFTVLNSAKNFPTWVCSSRS